MKCYLFCVLILLRIVNSQKDNELDNECSSKQNVNSFEDCKVIQFKNPDKCCYLENEDKSIKMCVLVRSNRWDEMKEFIQTDISQNITGSFTVNCDISTRGSGKRIRVSFFFLLLYIILLSIDN